MYIYIYLYNIYIYIYMIYHIYIYRYIRSLPSSSFVPNLRVRGRWKDLICQPKSRLKSGVHAAKGRLLAGKISIIIQFSYIKSYYSSLKQTINFNLFFMTNIIKCFHVSVRYISTRVSIEVIVNRKLVYFTYLRD